MKIEKKEKEIIYDYILNMTEFQIEGLGELLSMIKYKDVSDRYKNLFYTFCDTIDKSLEKTTLIDKMMNEDFLENNQ